jgi:CRP-like cAMP-binding protein
MRLPAEVGNRILDALPTNEYRRLITRMRPVELPRGKVLYNAGDRADVAYFPIRGVVSLLSTTESGEIIEVGMVGNEGTTGLPVITHQQEMPYRVLVQIAGEGVKIDSETVRREFSCAGRFHDLLICYTHSLFAEITQSAVCNRFHVAEARFARWLLSMHDRVGSDTLTLTHEIISYMLGAERSNVTRIARTFQNNGLIQYRYGSITILNRAGLEAASCECYAVVKQSVRRCRAA